MLSHRATARSLVGLLIVTLAALSAAAPVVHTLSGAPDAEVLAASRGEVSAPEARLLAPVNTSNPLAVCGVDTSVKSSISNVCKMTFRAADNRVYVCTGWLIAQNKVATAGHCVLSKAGWIRSADFVCGGVRRSATTVAVPFTYYQATFVRKGSGVHWADAAVVRVSAAFPPILRPYNYRVGSPCSGSRPANVAGYPATTEGRCHFNGVQQWSSTGRMSCKVNGAGFLQADFDSCGGGSGSRVVAPGTTTAIGIFVMDSTLISNGACVYNGVTRILDGGGSGLGVFMQPMIKLLG